ncbi:helix-turn-helix domain-containing protein [Alkalimarinus coralli]
MNNSNLNVTEVAAEVGYENISHFIAAYKKKYVDYGQKISLASI